MRLWECKTGTIIKDNAYYLVLGISDSVIEDCKKAFSFYGINAIGRSIEYPLHVYGSGITLLALQGANVDFTQEINESLLFKANMQYLYNCKAVKIVKIQESWILKNQILRPNLRRLKTVEDGIKELQQELDKNKYKIAVDKIKKKRTFQKITWVKTNQIVAAKLEMEYKIFLVEDTRVTEFIPYRSLITNLANIDLSKMQIIETRLEDATEYYLLGEIK